MTARLSWPYTIDQLIRDNNSNVSFPNPLNATVLSDFGVYKVVPTAPPEYDMFTQELHQDTRSSLMGSIDRSLGSRIKATPKQGVGSGSSVTPC